MIFDDQNNSPFYLNEKQKDEQLLDKPTGVMIEKKKSRAKVVEELKRNNIDFKGNTKQLCTRCIQAGIAIKYTEEKIIEGWFNKPKGALQILYERGWINPDLLQKKGMYTKEGVRDAFGNLLPGTSIKK